MVFLSHESPIKGSPPPAGDVRSCHGAVALPARLLRPAAGALRQEAGDGTWGGGLGHGPIGKP